jgi:hypothetical protein
VISRYSLLAPFSIGLLTGCANIVTGGSGGDTGVSVASGTGGNTGVSVASGTGGQSQSSSSGANPEACLMPLPSLSFELTVPGMVPSSEGVLEVEGSVQSSDHGVILIETCAPNADCASTIATVDVTENGLHTKEVPVPIGALVHVESLDISLPNPVTINNMVAHLLVQNIPTWGSQNNPISSSSRVWLSMEMREGTGGFNAFDPIVVQDDYLCGPGAPGSQAIGIDVTIDGGPLLSVGSGNRGTVDVTGVLAGHYTVENLYRFGPSGDGGPIWAYWIVGQ